MKLSKREIVLLLVLLVLGTGYLLYQYVYLDKQAQAASLEAGLDANRLMLEQLKADTKKEENYTEELTRLNQEIRSIERKIPYYKDMPGMLVKIYYLMLEHSMNGESISFSNITETPQFNYYNMSFMVTGQKNDIYQFVKQLENFEKILSIENIKFTMVDGSIMDANMNIRVYLLKGDGTEKLPEDYDFMEGTYGTFKELFDKFKAPINNDIQ